MIVRKLKLEQGIILEPVKAWTLLTTIN